MVNLTLDNIVNIVLFVFLASWFTPRKWNGFMFAVRALLILAIIILDLVLGYTLVAGLMIVWLLGLAWMANFWAGEEAKRKKK